ncbi:MAG: TRAP transporter small permease subunit, partial [Pseudomonadota bacterium]
AGWAGEAAGCRWFWVATIVATVLVQVVFNMVDALALAVGAQPVGLVLPSYAEFTGYFLAAASFLAAAHTLQRGALIRVNLVMQRLRPKSRRIAEIWCAAVGTLFSAYFTWWMILLVLESLEFNDVSPGMIPVPIWIPQLSIALGMAVFTLALADRTMAAWHGRIADDAGEA